MYACGFGPATQATRHQTAQVGLHRFFQHRSVENVPKSGVVHLLQRRFSHRPWTPLRQSDVLLPSVADGIRPLLGVRGAVRELPTLGPISVPSCGPFQRLALSAAMVESLGVGRTCNGTAAVPVRQSCSKCSSFFNSWDRSLQLADHFLGPSRRPLRCSHALGLQMACKVPCNREKHKGNCQTLPY